MLEAQAGGCPRRRLPPAPLSACSLARRRRRPRAQNTILAVWVVVVLGSALIVLAIYFQEHYDQWYFLQNNLVGG